MPPRIPDPLLQALTPFQLVLVTLYGECRGEPIEAQVGIANVLRNRLESGRWGTTYHSMLLQWAQFSCLWPGLVGPAAWKHLTDFAKRVAQPETFHDYERQLNLVVQGLFGDALIDNTKGATHYLTVTPQIIQSPPGWTKPPAIQTVQLGHELFYRGVP